MKIVRFLPIAFVFLAWTAQWSSAAESENTALIDQIIQKYRETRGSEDDLKNVKALTMKGSILYGTGSTGTVELIYKNPHFHYMKSIIDNSLEVSGLDDSEAWLKSASAATPNNWSLLILEADQVFNMRAKVSETLNFLARPKGRSSQVSYEGEHEIEGLTCHALLYSYGADVWNIHYFDKDSGELVKSVSNKGIETFGKGEIVVDGIRFPKKMISVFYTPEGRGTMEMSFSSVAINEKHGNDLFKMPSVTQ